MRAHPPDMLDRRTFSLALVSCFALSLSARSASAASDLTFVLYKDKAAEFRWRLKASNGEILATSGDGYKSKASAKQAIESLQSHADDAKRFTFEVYSDAKGEYRFRIVAKNGQKVGASSEGYKDKADAEKAVASIKKGAASAAVNDET
jgi:uncharacterized protein YegP (UPF0339 family)